MKKAIILIIFFTLISCNNYKHFKNVLPTYTIYKIDSINNYYLIYAERNNSIFKIVSKKEHITKHYKKIKIGNNYDLNLDSRSSQTPIINGVKMSPVNLIDSMCYNYEENTQICTDAKNGIYDLYTTVNLKGLYYIK
ncbi:Uncharacterised protein [Chryseobacterium nakagawai]|uniref:hypothetical protein n=1 Tax=Chryseobacterium nakagawai TaxID=1241982 RepID=UPI000F50C3D0|nr:hypothetical protein [Chryseobacterium nakagawai]VEH21403.1 Uncharacterised protein [Chryseobacterium nakagawai]